MCPLCVLNVVQGCEAFHGFGKKFVEGWKHVAPFARGGWWGCRSLVFYSGAWSSIALIRPLVL